MTGHDQSRQQRQGHGTERDAEQAQRQLHQSKRDREPEDRSVAERRSKHRIDQHIELRGARGDHRGAHQQKNRLHAGVAPSKIGPEAIAEPRQRRQLDGELQRAAEHRGQPQSEQGPRTEVRVDPEAESHPADDRPQIEEARCHRRHPKDALGIEHPHDQCRDRNQKNERKHDAGQLGGQGRLFGVEPRRQCRHELGRKNHPGGA